MSETRQEMLADLEDRIADLERKKEELESLHIYDVVKELERCVDETITDRINSCYVSEYGGTKLVLELNSGLEIVCELTLRS